MLELGFYVEGSSAFQVAAKLRISGIPLFGLLLHCLGLSSIHSR